MPSPRAVMRPFSPQIRYGVLLLVSFLLAALSVSASATEQPLSQQATERTVPSPLDERIALERAKKKKKFVLSPHRPNYLLPIAYNAHPNRSVVTSDSGASPDKTEVKFQLSMKYPVAENLFGERAALYFAYTNLSFWQAYNSSVSSPFRETVHEPEVFLAFPNDWTIWGFKNRLMFFGVSHQSNGRSDLESRSWNRIFADFIFEKENWYLSVKPWLRIPESDDDNPDIEDFLGHGELRLAYAKENQTASLLIRGNPQTGKGAVSLNWSFPMSRRVKWFLHYFNGYGESLIDYNISVNRLGIGIAFTDWL